MNSIHYSGHSSNSWVPDGFSDCKLHYLIDPRPDKDAEIRVFKTKHAAEKYEERFLEDQKNVIIVPVPTSHIDFMNRWRVPDDE